MIVRSLVALGMCLGLLGCEAKEAIDATISMQKQMGDMNRKMATIESAANLQTLEVAVKEMTRLDAFWMMEPVPTQILPYAEAFARRATAKELVELTYLWLKEINEVELVGEGTLPPEMNLGLPTLETVSLLKFGKLTALSAVAGMTPQRTVEKLVREQIYAQGRYAESAYEFLSARAKFIREVRLKNGLLNQDLNVVGELEETVEYLKQLDYLAQQPFSEKIAVRTSGIREPFKDRNLNENMDEGARRLIANMWKTTQAKALSELKFEKSAITGNEAQDEALLRNYQRRFVRSIDEISRHLSKWQRLLPPRT